MDDPDEKIEDCAKKLKNKESYYCVTCHKKIVDQHSIELFKAFSTISPNNGAICCSTKCCDIAVELDCRDSDNEIKNQ